MSFLSSQFEGCLLGVLLGDSLGRPFEFKNVKPQKVQSFFDKIENTTEIPQKSDELCYSDDTAMTLALSNSIIECGGEISPSNLAKHLSENFIRDGKDRGYGKGAKNILTALSTSNFEDPFTPASKEFNGKGSLGNGAGMRAAPLALITSQSQDFNKFLNMIVNSSKITHANPMGVFGGVFQAISVRAGIYFGEIDRVVQETSTCTDPSSSTGCTSPLEMLKWVRENLEKTLPLSTTQEIDASIFKAEHVEQYLEKLNIIESFLKCGNENVSLLDVQTQLGNGVKALDSIPTALYCFLSSFNPIPNISTEDQFLRCIQYAISLGGDTDTVASMAGSITGAYLGREGIPEKFMKNCEGWSDICEVSKKLYELRQ